MERLSWPLIGKNFPFKGDTMAKSGKGGKKHETYIVQSKVKGLVKKAKMKCSSDVMSKINGIIAESVGKGCERAKANGRKTLRAADL